MDKMSPEEIVAALRLEYDAAEQWCNGDIADVQEAMLSFYDAEPFGDEQDGRSQVVLPDVAETVDYMTISVLEPFLSGDRVIEFEADEEEYDEAVADATEAVNYNFMRDQDGPKVLHDWLKSGLIEKYCAVKTVCQTEEKVSRETFILSDAQALALDEGSFPLPEGVTVEGVDPIEQGVQVTLKTEKTVKKYIDIPLPSEEFRFSSNATHEDNADYLCHACPKTRSELVEMGFDKDQVYELKQYDREITDTRQYQRDNDYEYEESTEALQRVLLLEEYARMDVDGDGIAERVKIYRVDDEILELDGEPAIETIDSQPIVVFTPFPRAHRMVGDGLAERVADIQRIRSLNARQLIEGLLNSNNPRPLVNMRNQHESTIEDLLNVIPGSPIRHNGEAPQPYQTRFDIGQSLAAMEYWSGERESRTGITRLNQGLDRDALNKTATGTALMQQQGQQYEQFIARTFAAALGRLFTKKYRLMKAESEKLSLKVDGKYKQVDASKWPDEMKVNVRVGLGTGSKDKRVQSRMLLLDMQREGLEIGLTDKEGLYKNGAALVRDLDLGVPDDYFINPSDGQAEPVEEGPSPEEQAMMMQAAEKEQQLALKRFEIEGNLEIKRYESDMRIDMEAAKIDANIDLKERQQMRETQLAERKQQREMYLAEQNALFERAMKADLPDNRPGGDLDK